MLGSRILGFSGFRTLRLDRFSGSRVLGFLIIGLSGSRILGFSGSPVDSDSRVLVFSDSQWVLGISDICWLLGLSDSQIIEFSDPRGSRILKGLDSRMLSLSRTLRLSGSRVPYCQVRSEQDTPQKILTKPMRQPDNNNRHKPTCRTDKNNPPA